MADSKAGLGVVIRNSSDKIIAAAVQYGWNLLEDWRDSSQSKEPEQVINSRKCNIIAHSLAKVALDYENPAAWLEEFPVQIMLLLSKFVL